MMQVVGPSLNLGTGDGTIEAFWNDYSGSGSLCPGGPRHDNEFLNIGQIRIAPTREELVCREQPLLPANIYGAPHPFPPDSMERHLDIHFRLLREELR